MLIKSESLDNEYDESYFIHFWCFFLLSRPLLLDLLYLMSSEESDYLNDESDDGGSESGSSGTCAFPFCFYNYVGHVGGVGSGIFFNGISLSCLYQ